MYMTLCDDHLLNALNILILVIVCCSANSFRILLVIVCFCKMHHEQLNVVKVVKGKRWPVRPLKFTLVSNGQQILNFNFKGVLTIVAEDKR